MSEQILSCSFCGKRRDAVDKLIAGPNVYICNECISLSYSIVSDTVDVVTAAKSLDNIPTPSEIKSKLDEYIIGHEEAKEMLAVSAYNHYKRIFSNTEIEMDKSNILMVGPTGTGKTLFAKTLAKVLDVPFAIADATTLTESGYVGEDVESVVERLLSSSEYDIESAQKGIIYIDEIDKKARKGDKGAQSRDVSGEGVQQALLRLIEGTTMKVKVGNRRFGNEDTIDFDTNNILFIVGGAFVGIERHIEDRLKGSSRMGFGAKVLSSSDRKALLSDLTAEDVVSYGLIPEFVGRLPIMGVLDPLDETQLRRILTEVKNSLLAQVKQMIKLDGIDVEFGEEYLAEVAKQALEKKLGARALKSIVDRSLINVMYRAPDLHKTGVIGVKFDKYPLTQNVKPMLIYADGQTQTDNDYRLYRHKHDSKDIQTA